MLSTPVAEEKVPAGQSRHEASDDSPKPLLYRPATHARHCVLSPFAKVPGWHSVQLVCPNRLTQPTGHAAQRRRTCPEAVSTNFPGRHKKQTVDPASLTVSRSHEVHSVALTVSENVLLGQSSQTDCPLVFWNFPGTQGKHIGPRGLL